MTLVDLRDRLDEPAVLVFLGDTRPDSDEILAGWEENGRLVGCAGLVRRNADELEVRRLLADEEFKPLLLEGLADVATAQRLVAPDGTVIRELSRRTAAPEAVAANTLDELERAIRAAWGRETSDDPAEWSEENPARGQCAGTALLVRELLGGEILVANVLRAGARVERHAWNRLPSGITIDLTREQYRNGECFEEPSVVEPMQRRESIPRYRLLSQRVRAALVDWR
jgi:hypothetical protein